MTYNPQFAENATPAGVVAASDGGTLNIYGGAQPAGPDVIAETQALLASVPVPAFGVPVISGTAFTAEATAFLPATSLLAGMATWFRVLSPTGTPVFDGAVGDSNSDLILSPTTFIATGVTVTITSLTVSGQASQNVTGVASVAVPVPGPAAPTVPSGFGGTEPAFAGAISWCGYRWEPENWGTNNGGPTAANVSVDANGYLNLTAAYANGNLMGAEVDSVRGDQGIAGNASTWGYGSYRWVLGSDLSSLPYPLVTGLFSFWAFGSPTSTPPNANGKGGPLGNTEIDIEIYSGLTAEDPFFQLGFYQDAGGGATEGVPETNNAITHTLATGSQLAVPPGHPVTTIEFNWLPTKLTWNIWYGTDTSGTPDYTLTLTEGEEYTYTQPFGGNTFSGTVSIPKTGNQQVIMNLWSQGQNVDMPETAVIIRSFAYTPSS